MAYHTVVLPQTVPALAISDDIKALVEDNILYGVFGWIVSDNDPNGSLYNPFNNGRWCKRFSAFSAADGASLANSVAVHLWQHPYNRAIIDEVNTNTTVNQKVSDAADILGVFPEFWNRWGAYVVRAGSVSVLQNCQPALDSVFRATGTVAWEAYVKYSTYCNQHPTNVGVRDVWLGNYFRDRMDYFVQRRSAVAISGWPLSYIHPIFGVTDANPNPSGPDLKLMNCTNPAKFLSRMFYVWKTRSGYAGNSHANGGAGSYKWESEAVNNTSRDTAFRNAWSHYCKFNSNTYDYSSPPECSGCGP